MSGVIDTEVLILGGGPTGMVAALALSRLGVSSVLVERLRAVAPHPKAHELSPRSIEILTSLGVPFDAIDAEASPYEESARVLFCSTLGEEIGRIDLAEDGADRKYFRELRAPKPFLNLSQSALEQALRARVEQSAGVRCLFGHRWTGMSDDAGDAWVRSTVVPVGEGGEAFEVCCRYVLSADGAGSPSRRALGIAMKGPDRIQDFVNAYFEHDLTQHVATRAKLYFMLDPVCPGTFVSHHAEKRWVYHMPVFPPADRPEDHDAPALLATIEHALGSHVKGLRIRSVETWRMTAQVAERFREGRAFLVGDAAHRFPPTGGLGMNSGIADAHNLCWKLAAVLHGTADPALLDTYEAERRPVALRNCRESVENYERIFDVAEAFGLPRKSLEWSARVRAWLSRWLPLRFVVALFALLSVVVRWRIRRARAVPALRARVDAAIAAQRGHFDRLGLDLGAEYASGAVVPDATRASAADHDVSDYHPSTRPGARLRHVWLDDEKTRSSHDLLDDRCFTLLVGPSGEAWGRTVPDEVFRAGVVRVVPLDRGTDPRRLFEIDPSGALLVRPDGYVAWRAESALPDAAAAMRSVLGALCMRLDPAARPMVEAAPS